MFHQLAPGSGSNPVAWDPAQGVRGCSFAGRAGGSWAGFDPSRFVSSWCEGGLLGKGVGMGMSAGGTLRLRLNYRRSSWVEKWIASFRGIWFDRPRIVSDVGCRKRVGEGCQHRVKVKVKVADWGVSFKHVRIRSDPFRIPSSRGHVHCRN